MFEFSSVIGIIFLILFCIIVIMIAVLWVFIPFILLEIKNVLYKILYKLEK